MNFIASVTSKNFRFNSGLAINFEMMRIYAVYHAVGSIAIQPSRIKRSVHFFSESCCCCRHSWFFSSSSMAVLFLLFCSRHMISPVAIVRLSLWCQNPKKIIVSFRRFGTIYIYIPFFHPQINSNGLFACEYVGRAMCDFDNDGTLARERQGSNVRWMPSNSTELEHFLSFFLLLMCYFLRLSHRLHYSHRNTFMALSTRHINVKSKIQPFTSKRFIRQTSSVRAAWADLVRHYIILFCTEPSKLSSLRACVCVCVKMTKETMHKLKSKKREQRLLAFSKHKFALIERWIEYWLYLCSSNAAIMKLDCEMVGASLTPRLFGWKMKNEKRLTH